MTQEVVLMVVAALVEALLLLVPGLGDIWDSWKWRLYLLVAFCVFVPFAAWGAECWFALDLPGVTVTCDVIGMVSMITIGMAAFLSMMGVERLAGRRFRAVRAGITYVLTGDAEYFTRRRRFGPSRSSTD